MAAIVTTDRKCHKESLALAAEMAEKLGLRLAPRQKESVAELMERYQAEAVLVALQKELRLYTAAGELFFHPNMAQLRLKNLRLGDRDHMTDAMGLREGMSVLDCTLGLGSDAIVAGFGVGESGTVTGLEVSPLIAAVTGYGLQHFLPGNYPLFAAMRRIQVINIDCLDYLKKQSDNSSDVVYFDPMFRRPLTASSSISPLRGAADHRPLTVETVQEACRVARLRVVMKEANGSSEFARLGFARVTGGRYSRVHYGVIDVEGWLVV